LLKAKQLFKSYRRSLLAYLSKSNHPLYLGYYRYLYKPHVKSIAYHLDQISTKEDFYVVQIGANDGITHDPIHKFIKRNDWSGVLLEPQRDVFEQSLYPLYEDTPNVKPICAALGHEDGEFPIYRIGFSTARWATGLTSFDRSVLEKAFLNGHVSRQAAKVGEVMPDDRDKWIIEEPVVVVSVASLQQEYGFQKIDLLQIDTEGFDFEIIKMFDFGTLRPGAISYEHAHFSAEVRDECEEHLRSSGYKLFHFDGNSLAL